MRLDIVREGGDWETIGDVEAVATRAAAAAARCGGAPPESEATLLLTDDDAMRELNRRWRGFDKPTNVLSFPAAAPQRPEADATPLHLGDVAIAFETLRREAQAEGKPAPDHLAHLVVHGVLHLLGRDHDEPEAADAMEALEVAALASIDVPDPYRDTVPDRGPG